VSSFFANEKQETASLRFDKDNLLKSIEQLKGELHRVQTEYKELNNDRIQSTKESTLSSIAINDLKSRVI
jgi:cell division protein FtsL